MLNYSNLIYSNLNKVDVLFVLLFRTIVKYNLDLVFILDAYYLGCDGLCGVGRSVDRWE